MTGIGACAVGAQDAREIAQYFAHRRMVLPWLDLKEGGVRCVKGEQDLLSFSQFPGCVINVEHGGVAHVISQGLVKFSEGPTHLLAQSRDGAQANPNPRKLGQQLLAVPVAERETSLQYTYERHQIGPELTARKTGGHLGFQCFVATGTVGALSTDLQHLRDNSWHFPNLSSSYRSDVSRNLGGAFGTMGWECVRLGVRHLIILNQCAIGTFVARLPSSFLSTRLLRGAQCARGILRGRQTAVT